MPNAIYRPKAWFKAERGIQPKAASQSLNPNFGILYFPGIREKRN
jgi:hypothetical protein